MVGLATVPAVSGGARRVVGGGEGVASVSSTFLDADELVELTGRKRASHQVPALKSMGIPFWVNAAGRPVVARTAVEGGTKKQVASAQPTAWTPRPLRAA